jgi:outer membrane lipoprotein SlyB
VGSGVDWRTVMTMAASRRSKRPVNSVAAVSAVAGLALGVWVSAAVARAGVLATVITLVAGLVYGLLLFGFPPRNRAIGLGLLALVPVVMIVIVANQDIVGSVQYAWILGFIAGGIARGYGQMKAR